MVVCPLSTTVTGKASVAIVEIVPVHPGGNLTPFDNNVFGMHVCAYEFVKWIVMCDNIIIVRCSLVCGVRVLYEVVPCSYTLY